jgi:hypothetical protein
VVENGIRARDMVMFQVPLTPSSMSNRDGNHWIRPRQRRDGNVPPPSTSFPRSCAASWTSRPLPVANHCVDRGPHRRTPPSYVLAQRRTSDAAHRSPRDDRSTGAGKSGCRRSRSARCLLTPRSSATSITRRSFGRVMGPNSPSKNERREPTAVDPLPTHSRARGSHGRAGSTTGRSIRPSPERLRRRRGRQPGSCATRLCRRCGHGPRPRTRRPHDRRPCVSPTG